jgi:glycosyltransferase involved in cell wall biosynthesis
MIHIVHVITGLHRGGAETVLVTLVTEFAQQKYAYKQSVIFFKDGPLHDDLKKLGVATYQVSYFTLFKTIRTLKPDSIHSALWSANIFARLAGYFLNIPVYCALHTVAAHSGFLRNFVDFLLPIHPENYIAVSRTVHESYDAIVPAYKLVTIENGILASTPYQSPLDLAHPEQSRRVSEVKQKNYVIGAVGRFVPVKNFDILLHAYAQLYKEFKHIRLIIVGHGPLEQLLRDLAQQLEIHEMVTFVINKPAHNYYPLIDCFVQPSAHEGLSIALLEALQAQLPAIVTGHQHAHACVMHKKSGLVIEPNHLISLYEALRKYILYPEVADAYARAGHTYVQEHFSAATMAQRYSELLLIKSVKST